MAQAIVELNTFRDKYNFATVLIHHTKKGTSAVKTNSDMQSGAGALTDLVDADFFLRKTNLDVNCKFLKREKSRNTEDTDTGKLIVLNPETLWFEVLKDCVREETVQFGTRSNAVSLEKLKEVYDQRKSGLALDEIAVLQKRDKATISRWLKKYDEHLAQGN